MSIARLISPTKSPIILAILLKILSAICVFPFFKNAKAIHYKTVHDFPVSILYCIV